MPQQLNSTSIHIADIHDVYNNNSSTFAATSNVTHRNADGNQERTRLKAGKHSGEQKNRTVFRELTPYGERILLFLASADGKQISMGAALNNIKIVLLVILWLFVIVLMVNHKVQPAVSCILTIEQNKSRIYAIPHDQIGDEIGIVVYGPFEDGHMHDGKVVEEMLTMNVVSDANAGTKVTEDWHIHLLPGDPEQQRTVQRLHVFKVTTKLSDAEKQKMQLSMTATKQVTIKLKVDAMPVNRRHGIIPGALVLILMYALIVTEIIERTIASIICATLAVSLLASYDNDLSMTTVMSYVDVETLLLLFCMMILIALLSDSGIFDFFAVYAYQISKGYVWPLLTSLCLFTAVLSAFLDNVTMMLLVAPIVIRLCEALTLDPVLMLTIMVIYSNIGAASTPIGDPPNIIITTNAYIAGHGINFANFMWHCVPCVVLVTVQTYYMLRFIFRDEDKLKLQSPLEETIKRMARQSAHIKSLAPVEAGQMKSKLRRKSTKLLMEMQDRMKRTPEYNIILEELKSQYGIKDMQLLIKLAITFGFVILLFFLHGIHGLHQLSLGWVALVGALAAFAVVKIDDFESLLHRVEWSTLIFFASLFIVMEVLTKIGLISLIGEFVEDIILLVDRKYRLLLALMLILWVSAIASAFLDNIPVTAMMLPIVISMSKDQNLQLSLHPLVWALALGACFGGNGTLIAASANVVSAGIAQQHGYRISFTAFFVLGFPIMLVNIVVTSFYLIFCHVIFEWHDPPKYN